MAFPVQTALGWIQIVACWLPALGSVVALVPIALVVLLIDIATLVSENVIIGLAIVTSPVMVTDLVISVDIPGRDACVVVVNIVVIVIDIDSRIAIMRIARMPAVISPAIIRWSVRRPVQGRGPNQPP